MIGKLGLTTRRYRAPSAVVGLAATRSDMAFTLTWSTPTDDGGLPITDYDVTIQGVTSGSPTTTSTGGATSITFDSGLTEQFYSAIVVAKNASGDSSQATTTVLVEPRRLNVVSVLNGSATVGAGLGTYADKLNVTNGSSGVTLTVKVLTNNTSLQYAYVISGGSLMVGDSMYTGSGSSYSVVSQNDEVLFTANQGATITSLSIWLE